MVRFIAISLVALASACASASEVEDVRTDVGHNDEVTPLTVKTWADSNDETCNVTFHAEIASRSTEPGSGTVTVGDWRWAEFAVGAPEWRYTSHAAKLPAGPWAVEICVRQGATDACTMMHITSKCDRSK